jgi:hypothetical protein
LTVTCAAPQQRAIGRLEARAWKRAAAPPPVRTRTVPPSAVFPAWRLRLSPFQMRPWRFRGRTASARPFLVRSRSGKRKHRSTAILSDKAMIHTVTRVGVGWLLFFIIFRKGVAALVVVVGHFHRRRLSRRHDALVLHLPFLARDDATSISLLRFLFPAD